MFKILVLTLLLALANMAFAQEDKGDVPEGMVPIPGGIVMISSDEGQRISAPKRLVSLHAFYMDIHEVSNGEYHSYCMDTGSKFPEFWGMDIYKSGMDFPDLPVVSLSQFNATQYIEWAAKRLPTEAE